MDTCLIVFRCTSMNEAMLQNKSNERVNRMKYVFADFVAAAALFAVAAMTELDELAQMEMITTGDLTLRRKSTDAAACCLRYQAELLMTPYMADTFAFLGV